MREAFMSFIQEPTAEGYLQLRELAFEHPDFNPYGNETQAVDDLIEAGQFDEAVERAMELLIPDTLLSPMAHMRIAFAQEKLGNQEACDAERYIASALLHGIEATGDGTADRPYQISRVSDEYDLVSANGWTFQEQALRARDGREFDVITVAEREPIWFEITEIRQLLERRFGGG